MATAKNQNITDGKVVQYHYTMKGPDGSIIESSKEQGGEPVAYLHGAGELVPGLEEAMNGRKPGDRFTITVPAAEAFGTSEPPEQADRPVTREELPDEVEVGDPIIAMDEDGEQDELWVKSVSKDEIVLTSNHPLADQDLTFDVEVIDLRDANDEEREAGAAFGWSGDESPFDDDDDFGDEDDFGDDEDEDEDEDGEEADDETDER